MATGGKKIADVVAVVRLDTSNAAKELKAGVKKAEATLQPVKVDVDTKTATQKTKKEIEAVKPEVEVQTDVARGTRKVKKEIEAVKPKVEVDVDTKKAQEKIAKDVPKTKPKVSLKIDKEEADKLVSEYFAHTKASITPEVNVAAFRAKMIALGKIAKPKIETDVDIKIPKGILGQTAVSIAGVGGQAATSFIGGFGQAIKTTAGWRTAIEAASPEMLGAIAPVVVAVGVAVATIMGQAIASAFLTGAAGGALALGIYGAAKNPKVREAAKSISDAFKEEALIAGSAFVNPVIRGLNSISRFVREIDLASLVRPLSRSVEPLINGIIAAIQNALPGIREAVAASAPFINAVADKLPDMGKAIGYFASSMAKASGSAAGFFRSIMSLVDGILYAVGAFIRVTDYAVSVMEKVRPVFEWMSFILGGPIGTMLTKSFFDGKKASDELTKSMKNQTYESSVMSEAWLDQSKKASDATMKVRAWAKSFEAASGIQVDVSGLKSMNDIGTALNNTLKSTRDKIDEVVAARMRLRDDILSGAQTEIAWNQWLSDRATQLASTTATLDLNTQAGRDNKTMLLEGVSALNSYLTSQANSITQTQGATAAEEWLTNARAAGNEELVNTAMKLGLTREQADALVASMLQTNQDIEASVKLNGYDQMQAQLKELNSQIVLLQANLAQIQAVQENRTYTGTTNSFEIPRRFGGIAYARNGLLNLKDKAGIFPPTQGNLYGFAEPGTGGEAFIAKNAPRDASLTYLDTAAKWHNARVVTEDDLKQLSKLFDGGPQNGAAKSWDDSWNGASTTVGKSWSDMSTVTQSMFDTILGKVLAGTEQITKNFGDMGVSVNTASQGMLTTLSNGFTSSFAYIDGLIAQWSDTTVSAFSALSARLATVFRGIPRQAWESLSGVVVVVNDLVAKLNSIDGVHIAPMAPIAAPPAAFAKGGKVFGPGTGTSDSVDAKLSRGEFVLKADAVTALEKTYGTGFLNHMNNFKPVGGDRSTGAIMQPRFAEGGHVQAALDLLKQYNGRPYVFGGTPPNTDCSGWVGMGWAAALGKDPFRRYFDTTSVLSTGNWAPGAVKNGFNINLNPNPGASGHISGELAGHRFESGGSHGYSAFDGPSAAIGSFGSQYHSLDVKASKTDQVRDILANPALMDSLRAALPKTSGLFAGVPDALFNKVITGLTAKDWDLFDDGGMLKTLGINRSGKPEAVLTNDEYRMFKKLVSSGGQSITLNYYGSRPGLEDQLSMRRDLRAVAKAVAL